MPERLAKAWSRWAFWATLAAFVVGCGLLASKNTSPGSSDSVANLVLARNLVSGKGYVSRAVGELWVVQPIGSVEPYRSPGVPFLLAGMFRLVGVRLAVPVVLNALTVLTSALLLRSAISRKTCVSLGDLAGVLVLVSHNSELVSIWNNNLLVLGTCALFWLEARRDRGMAAYFGIVAAAGFLMKPTFMLGAIPFAILVLGTDARKSVGRRFGEVIGFLLVFLILSSPYWARNIALYGEPLYAPGFKSNRLAFRYGIFGSEAWRTVRFGQPMTYGEVIDRIGWSGLIVADLKTLAKTLFYAILLNPAVAACASLLVLFARPSRWKDYAGPFVIIVAVVFEVGVYNHHEYRYLWPIYPALIVLAALALRDYQQWGRDQMTPELELRARVAFTLLGAAAVLVSLMGGAMNASGALKAARSGPPSWLAAVEELPADAVILTLDVAPVAWWADRGAVIAPAGSRADLSRVVELYHVSHYLALDPSGPPQPVAFEDGDLELLDQGPGWKLYRIRAAIRPEIPRKPG